MEPISTNQSLAGRTIMVAPSGDSELAAELKRHGARVLPWPQIEIVEPDSYAALDEAIENLFGYDWLIFANVNAAGFFLRRIQSTGHEISELDALRVCALDDATRQQLEESHVHVDLNPEGFATDGVLATLERFVGGRDSLRRLNFLIPRAAISRDYLPQALEDAGARVDVVAGYRTVSNNSELIQFDALLAGGGIDCIAFTNPSSVLALSLLFDTNELSRLFKEVAVACIDQATRQAVKEFGLISQIEPAEGTGTGLAHAIATYFQ